MSLRRYNQYMYLSNIYIDMRRKYNEQLLRIKQLIYGKKSIHEAVQKVTKKADVVKDNLSEFYKNLESIDSDIDQQFGNYEYKKQVESVQIGLLLLGYQLPKFGVDGKFGPETSRAVTQFKKDNNIKDVSLSFDNLTEYINEVSFVALNKTSFSNVKFDKDETQYDTLSSELLKDMQKAAESAGVIVTITTAKSGHRKTSKSGYTSRHMSNVAADIAIIDGFTYSQTEFKKRGDKFVKELEKLGYVRNKEMGNTKAVIWQSDVGGNHFNHVHVSNKQGVTGSESTIDSKEKITPNMVKVLINLLKQKNIKSEDLSPYINLPTLSGGDANLFTDLNLNESKDYELYAKICENFIDRRAYNFLNLSGDMFASAAKKYFSKGYLPPELAMAQAALEGAFVSSKTAKPVRLKNPFNVGNFDDGREQPFKTSQDGIDAYYNLMTKNYLVNKSAKDLIQNFVNKNNRRYASSVAYESQLMKIIRQVKNISNNLV